jgi:hypothetical protein
MSSTPTRPDADEPEITEEEKAIIRERLAIFEEDRKRLIDADKVIAEARSNLKRLQPK